MISRINSGCRITMRFAGFSEYYPCRPGQSCERAIRKGVCEWRFSLPFQAAFYFCGFASDA